MKQTTNTETKLKNRIHRLHPSHYLRRKKTKIRSLNKIERVRELNNYCWRYNKMPTKFVTDDAFTVETNNRWDELNREEEESNENKQEKEDGSQDHLESDKEGEKQNNNKTEKEKQPLNKGDKTIDEIKDEIEKNICHFGICKNILGITLS